MKMQIKISKEETKDYGKIINITWPDDCKIYFSKKGCHLVLSEKLTQKYYDKKPKRIEVLFNPEEVRALGECIEKIDIDKMEFKNGN